MKVFSKFLIFLLEFIKEFLCMRSGLGRSPCSNMFLDLFPLLAEVLEGLQESEMLILGPPAHFELAVVLFLVFTSHISRVSRDLKTLCSL